MVNSQQTTDYNQWILIPSVPLKYGTKGGK